MALSQLLYYSRLADGVDIDTLSSLVERAKQKNTAVDVTGLLAFNAEYFVQVLEGDRTDISRLYHRIAQDSRHTDPVLVAARPVDQRAFGRWGMHMVSMARAEREVLLRFSARPEFSPDQMTAEALFQLMLALGASE